MTQLCDEACLEMSTVLSEAQRLNPSAVITTARQAINTARRALDQASFEDYLSEMLAMHRAISRALPLPARLAPMLGRSRARPIADSLRIELEDALDVCTRSLAE